MNNIKKRFKHLMLMVLSLVLLLSTNVNAGSNLEERFENNVSSLYIASDPVSEGYINYAKEEKMNIFMSLPDVVSDELSYLDSDENIYFGNAFVLNDINYIPILANNKVIALLAVIETNGEYSWTLSSDFSDGLNSIAKKTSRNKPAVLYTDKGNVYANISGDIHQLTFNPEIKSIQQDNHRMNPFVENKEIVNVYNVSNKTEVKYSRIQYSTRASSSKYLTLDLKETQGDQSWCSAFAGAQILRYRGKGNIYAQYIMRYYYPNVSNTDLKDKSITNSELIKYANKKKSYPSQIDNTLSISTVKSQINSYKPIYLGCRGNGTYKKARHALVLRGYNTNSSTYSVWNPWNAKYVSMSTSSKSIAVSGGTFTWDTTIYGW
ncbi:MAG: C47 family peptidase [Eubacteriales bacterium]|nr:C47 family peptidase [Eubacteriales bacterium]